MNMMKSGLLAVLLVVFAVGIFILNARLSAATAIPDNPNLVETMPEDKPKATFAGGCFWCLESEFRNRPGVLYTRVGYSGGTLENPTYRDITTGRTGHAEAVEIYYDPTLTDYAALLDHFLRRAHNPTTLNRQGVDEGPQYRSVIFTHDAAQDRLAREAIHRIDGEGVHKNPIVTEIAPALHFWPAEEEHQQYYEKYERMTGQPHIRVILKNKSKGG